MPITTTSPVVLPSVFRKRIEDAAQAMLRADPSYQVSFLKPEGEVALQSVDSVSWHIFKNPISLYIGGIAAVILELGDASVRTGVWEHSSFKSDPVTRLRRTGLAAMVTVYGPVSTANAMIQGIKRRHEKVRGTTPANRVYHANDPELLTWVHATASFGFLQAYHVYVKNISLCEQDRYYREGVRTAMLYGAEKSIKSQAEVQALFAMMEPRLEPSPIIMDFLQIMRSAPVLPFALRPLQRLFVQAALELVPESIRLKLQLGQSTLPYTQRYLIQKIARLADRILFDTNPAVQSCIRLGLPKDYLYR